MSENTQKILRPRPIKGALLLCFGSLAFALLSCTLSVASLSSENGRAKLEKEILKAPTNQAGELPAETLLNIAVTTAVGMVVLFTVLNIALTLIIAYLILKGRKFVRTIMVALSALGAVNLLLSGGPWISVSSYTILLATAALLWLPSSSAAYFQAHASRRAKPTGLVAETT